MQSELILVYERFKASTSFSLEMSERLSPPLLLYVPKTWLTSKERILLVGQETLGWGFTSGHYYEWRYPPIPDFSAFKAAPVSVTAMVHGYKMFEFARHQPENYRSPFWRAYRQCRTMLGEAKDGIETSVLWTNLFRMSLDGGRVLNGSETEVTQLLDAGKELLRREILILRPTAVVFFTGPDYNSALYTTFPSMEVTDFNGHDSSRTAKVSHPDLPNRAWRTYHPNHLSFRKWHILDQVYDAITHTRA